MRKVVASFAEAWIEMLNIIPIAIAFYVASFAEAWIEMYRLRGMLFRLLVASFAEAWIEIANALPNAA